MKIIGFLLRYSPSLLALSIISGVVSGAASTSLIALVNESLDEINNPTMKIAITFGALMVLALLSELFSRLFLLRLSIKAVRKWRLNLCNQIMCAPYREVEKQGASGLMAVLTTDIMEVTEALIKLPVQCVNAAIIIVGMGYMFWLSWPLATTFLVLFVSGVLTYEYIVHRSKKHMKRLRENWDKLIGYYHGLIDGNKELKIHKQRRIAFQKQELNVIANDMMQLSWRFNKTFALAESSGQFIFYILIGVVLFGAPNFGIIETHILTGFILMLLFISGPISDLVGSIPKFHKADISMKKIQSLGFSLESSGKSDLLEEDVSSIFGNTGEFQIDLEALHYEYDSSDGRAFQVGPIDLTINSGELLFIIGGNGSGKSSFAKLITGLYTPKAGEMKFNGTVVDDSNRDGFRQHFSTIFSDYYLFKNLYGLVNKDLQEKVEQYLVELQLEDKVTFEEDKLSTVDLSSGQRKRLALLTSFLEDRQIYLFDEWAADQDPIFKQTFYHRILPDLKARGKTVIVISHDNQYFECADRMIRFEDGAIVEDRMLVDVDVDVQPKQALNLA